MDTKQIFETLGIEQTTDKDLIDAAYQKQLKNGLPKTKKSEINRNERK